MLRLSSNELSFLNWSRGFIELEATGGFEPPNRGFADLRLSPLGYVAPSDQLGAEGGI